MLVKVVRNKFMNLSIMSQAILMSKDSCCGGRHVIC